MAKKLDDKIENAEMNGLLVSLATGRTDYRQALHFEEDDIDDQ
jgi:hypothetical protein